LVSIGIAKLYGETGGCFPVMIWFHALPPIILLIVLFARGVQWCAKDMKDDSPAPKQVGLDASAPPKYDEAVRNV
jgi:hypothetical protein